MQLFNLYSGVTFHVDVSLQNPVEEESEENHDFRHHIVGFFGEDEQLTAQLRRETGVGSLQVLL